MKSSHTNSHLSSVLNCSCPKCREGNLFAPLEAKKPGSWFEMEKKCRNCGQTFEPEPGFYFGAMFISYALNTALFIVVWVVYSQLTADFSIWVLLVWMGVAALGMLPIFFRISRSIWISIFVRYQAPSSSPESNP